MAALIRFVLSRSALIVRLLYEAWRNDDRRDVVWMWRIVTLRAVEDVQDAVGHSSMRNIRTELQKKDGWNRKVESHLSDILAELVEMGYLMQPTDDDHVYRPTEFGARMLKEIS